MTARLEWLGTRAVMFFALLSIVIPLLVIATTAPRGAREREHRSLLACAPALGQLRFGLVGGGFLALMRSSAIVCVAVVPVGVILATCAGYAFGTMTSPASG